MVEGRVEHLDYGRVSVQRQDHGVLKVLCQVLKKMNDYTYLINVNFSLIKSFRNAYRLASRNSITILDELIKTLKESNYLIDVYINTQTT